MPAPQPPKPSMSSLNSWENEGGALRSAFVDEQVRDASTASDKGEILRCLGAGVVAEWNELPAGIKRALFRHAIVEANLSGTVGLREKIARFLHARAVTGRKTDSATTSGAAPDGTAADGQQVPRKWPGAGSKEVPPS